MKKAYLFVIVLLLAALYFGGSAYKSPMAEKQSLSPLLETVIDTYK